MSEDELMNVGEAEIEALDDQELESVAGGLNLDDDNTFTTAHSCMCCCGCGSPNAEGETES